jgi:hypothetical protein
LFEFENGGGGGSAWSESLRGIRHADGSYNFRTFASPTAEGGEDETGDTEWSGDKPVLAGEILQQLTEGLLDRRVREIFALEAAAALLPHLPKIDADLVRESMRMLYQANRTDQNDARLLAKQVLKLVERRK